MGALQNAGPLGRADHGFWWNAWRVPQHSQVFKEDGSFPLPWVELGRANAYWVLAGHLLRARAGPGVFT